MTDLTEVADVLDRAHDELLVRGWAKTRLENRAGALCAVGAVCAALGLERNYHVAIVDDRVRSVCARLPALDRDPFPDMGTEYWNDDSNRTLDEVLDAFRNAAKAAREEAGAA